MARERVNEIDLMRFIAAMMVVFFHYAFRGYAGGDRIDMPYPLLAPVAKYGYLGVELFFMISGFVILMTAASGSLRRFAVSRFVRLYPAFWTCCTITFLAILVMGGEVFSATLPQYLVNMTMLSGFVGVPSIDGVYWSLFVELKFYVMVAVLLAIGQIHHAQRWLVAWLLLSVAVEASGIERLRSMFITNYAAYFIAGATCYLVWLRGASKARVALLLACWAVATWQAVGGLAWFPRQFKQDINPLIVGAIITVFFVVMWLVAVRRTGVVGRRTWITVGALTYPLYLLHQNIGYMIFNAGYPALNPHLLMWGTIALMLALSWAVHAWVEHPLSSPLKRLANQAIDALARHTPSGLRLGRSSPAD